MIHPALRVLASPARPSTNRPSPAGAGTAAKTPIGRRRVQYPKDVVPTGHKCPVLDALAAGIDTRRRQETKPQVLAALVGRREGRGVASAVRERDAGHFEIQPAVMARSGIVIDRAQQRPARADSGEDLETHVEVCTGVKEPPGPQPVDFLDVHANRVMGRIARDERLTMVSIRERRSRRTAKYAERETAVACIVDDNWRCQYRRRAERENDCRQRLHAPPG